jgi:hypothetical protein
MMVCRALALVALLVGIPFQPATAQFGGMPGLPGSQPMTPGFGAAPAAPAAPPPICNELLAMRDQTQKYASAIGAANERKASAQEACGLFKTFLASESKMIKGVEDNASRCGIPPDVPKQMKAGHAKASEIAKKVCDAAAMPQRPAGPSFSDVLGAPTVPDKSTNKKGAGTFDTLTGNPLAR